MFDDALVAGVGIGGTTGTFHSGSSVCARAIRSGGGAGGSPALPDFAVTTAGIAPALDGWIPGGSCVAGFATVPGLATLPRVAVGLWGAPVRGAAVFGLAFAPGLASVCGRGSALGVAPGTIVAANGPGIGATDVDSASAGPLGKGRSDGVCLLPSTIAPA
jgi:hypothetical protein